VRFEESTNHTLPGHLRKRYPAGAAVYDFHYDYDFKNLRRDGGEIYFRADLSTHPGYWDTIVAAPVKRSGETWRDLDRRWLSELNPSAWLDHLKKVFGETAAEAEAEKMGLKALRVPPMFIRGLGDLCRRSGIQCERRGAHVWGA
jgi:hypothetical protein